MYESEQKENNEGTEEINVSNEGIEVVYADNFSQVSAILVSLGLDQYLEVFYSEEIDDQVLLHLDLNNAIEWSMVSRLLPKVGQQLKFRRAVLEYKVSKFHIILRNKFKKSNIFYNQEQCGGALKHTEEETEEFESHFMGSATTSTEESNHGDETQMDSVGQSSRKTLKRYTNILNEKLVRIFLKFNFFSILIHGYNLQNKNV